MSKTATVLLAIAALTAATSAQAGETTASLSSVKGEVFLAAGSGVTQAKAGSALKAGDRVVARAGGASIRYADGCVASVPAGGMATIAAKSPCAGGPGMVQASNAGAAQLIPIPKWPVGAYFAGAGVVVLVGAIIYGVSGAVSY